MLAELKNIPSQNKYDMLSNSCVKYFVTTLKQIFVALRLV